MGLRLEMLLKGKEIVEYEKDVEKLICLVIELLSVFSEILLGSREKCF